MNRSSNSWESLAVFNQDSEVPKKGQLEYEGNKVEEQEQVCGRN